MGQTVASNTGQMAIINSDTTKIFVGNNRYETATLEYTASGDTTFAAGTLIGRVSADQKLLPLASGASDGSQFPVGILVEPLTILDGVTFSDTVTICVAGDVDETKLSFDGSDDLDTVVSGRSLRDRIASDTVGIMLVSGDQLTGTDNQ